MIGQTFILIGRPKLVFRLVWRGSIGGIDCVRGVALNGKFQSFRRAVDVVFVEATLAAHGSPSTNNALDRSWTLAEPAFWQIGEGPQQIGELGVAVPLYEPRHGASPATAARLADDRQARALERL